MRKVIVHNIMSLDGFYAGPGDNVMVLPMDSAFNAYNVERLRSASTLLLGRISYEGFQSYWPSVVDDSSASADNREISRLNNKIQKVVVADSTPEKGAWASTTTVISRAAAHEFIRELKAQAGEDILVFGSHILWNDLLSHGLVDELHLTVGSKVLGGGVPIFEGDPKVSLEPIDTRTLTGECQNTLIRYRIKV